MITTKLLSVLLLALASGCLALPELPGRLVSRASSSRAMSRAAPFSVECDGSDIIKTSCTSCDEVLVCFSNIVNDKVRCTGATPFCNNGACSAQLSFSEVCQPKALTCSGVGFYPDPIHCNIYHYCSTATQPSDIYECPKNYVFNPATNMCKQKAKDADCMRVTCEPGKLMVSYGSSKTYYGFCAPSGVIMLRCPAGAVFDGQFSCTFQCTKEGNFGDDTNPAKFYQCYYPKGSNKLAAFVRTCTNNKVFSDKDGYCVRAS